MVRALTSIALLAALATAGCDPDGGQTTRFVRVVDATAPLPLTGTTYLAVSSETGTQDVWRADVPDGPWTRLAPPGIDLVHTVRVDPFRPDTIFVAGAALASGDGLASRSDDRGATWTRLRSGLPAASDPDRKVLFVEPDPAVRDRLWAGHAIRQGTVPPPLFRSDDGGLTWTSASTGLIGQGVAEIVFDAADARIRHVRTGEGVWRTTDAGASWARFDPGLPAAIGVRAIAADPSIAGRVWIAATNRRLYVSTGGAAFVERAAAGLEARPTSQSAFEPAQVTALAIDPVNPDRIYAGATRYGVFVSADGGATFAHRIAGMARPLSHFIDVRRFLIDPAAPLRILVATEDGLYISDDAADTWRPAGAANLPVLTRRAI